MQPSIFLSTTSKLSYLVLTLTSSAWRLLRPLWNLLRCWRLPSTVVAQKAKHLFSEGPRARLRDTQTRGLTDYGVKDGNPVVLFLEPNVLRYTHCETCNCRRMRRNYVSPHALKDYSLTYHTDGHGVRTILTPPAPLAAVCTIG